ncbi:hypothetical protein U6A24_01895 [Aquimarina gracilis]|uniref:Uncharacterized protein n=1 Tax=Aquimarina gracilis TaxID=874422 RepID=A0ABU5ZQ30_9FLAO|nr:hypothetical protein [Aquimarina gracilis]MEB3344190.1 hypothetical protein [Aquimarina gracilis]
MAGELNNEQEKPNFFNRISKYPIEYLGVALLGALIAFLIFGKQGRDFGPYPPSGNPVDTLSFVEILDFYDNFDNLDTVIRNYTRQRNNDPSFETSRAVSFDYQGLIDYLDFIQNNAEEANIKISQLRFYFGQYGSNVGKDKKFKQTLFFNPTTVFSSGEKQGDLSYAILRSGNKTSAVPLISVLDTLNEGLGQLSNEEKVIQEAAVISILPSSSIIYNGAESQARNAGQLSPPPSDIKDANQ